MYVLIACEFSGRVRDAFIARGHDAVSCDLLPTDSPGPHYQGDVRDILHDGWDMMIAHPPCTYLAGSGLHWNTRVPGRAALTEEALEFVRLLLTAPIPRIALENPIGCISSRIRKPDQIIQPWGFGEDASKATCLWLKGLPLLKPTNIIRKARYANQTPSGQNKLGPSADRAKLRSLTYLGIAEAMASQWGGIMLTAAEARAKLISCEERLIDRAILEIERRIDAVAETRTSICIRDDDDKLGQVVTDMLSSSGIGLSVQIELSRNGYSLSYGEYSATRYVEISWGE